MNGPDWLSGDEGLSPEILAAIRAADREDGTPAQVARLEARLAPLLGFAQPPGPAPSQALGARGAFSLGNYKLLSAALVVVGAGALVWSQRDVTPRSLPLATPVTVQVAEVPMPAPQARGPVVGAAPEVAEALAPVTVEPAPRAQEHATVSAAHRLAQEARLLKRARSLLASQPEEALQLTDRHRLRFPRGALVEEREVIAIKALRGLGRGELAAARQARFVRSFPESPHLVSLGVD